jgi:hypothetical protein
VKNTKKLASLFVLCLNLFVSLACFAQSKTAKFTVNGYLKDGKSGETLIGATLFIKEIKTGATSNEYGFYAISLPEGTYTFVYSFIGYKSQTKTVTLTENQKIDIEFLADEVALTEVVVTEKAEDENVKSVEMSVNKVEMSTIRKMPALLGEVDVIRSIQLLPGVSTVGEGATGFNVRGGNVDQNLVLLDEAPVFNSSHLFGFFSVFNPDAVKDIKLVKGGIPAQYGGRLSSLLDVRLKEGNNKKFAMQGGVGLIFSRLSLEAPIVKDKGSFIIAARRSYIDVLAKPFLAGNLSNSQFYFYDLTMKANYTLGKRDKIFLSGYFGRDVFGAGFRFNWGNTTATLRWNHIFSNKLFLNLTGYYSNYDYLLGTISTTDDGDGFKWQSNIINYSIKPEFTYYISPKNTLNFGGQFILHTFKPGSATTTVNSISRQFGLPEKEAVEIALYVGNEQKITDKLSLQYGLRYSYFNYINDTTYRYGNAAVEGTKKPFIGKEVSKGFFSSPTYGNFEPRAALNYSFNDRNSVKLSYNRMAQYIHLISNTTAATPLDVWTPSSNNVKPQIADQIALGYFRNFKDNAYEFSIEGYYKDMQNQIDYIDGANLFLNEFIEQDLLNGKGRAYGLEFYLKKSKGKFTGWISYTLSRTERQVNGINSNDWFPTRFDKPHNLSVVAFYEVSKKVSLSANFVFGSGTPSTFPTDKFVLRDIGSVPNSATEARNSFRIPPYHRLDVSLTWDRLKPNRRWQGSWVFAIYNLYNRRNPFGVYFRQNPDNLSQTQAIEFSVFGAILPSVTYNFKF